MERFYHSRVLYENRERQSRTYSWPVFILSNIAVEFVSQSIISVVAYASWYYPLGLWKKADAQGELNSRSVLVFLLIWSLLILFQTLSQMLMTVMPDIPTGINIGSLLFMLSLIFSGYVNPAPTLKLEKSVRTCRLTVLVSSFLRVICPGFGCSCIEPRRSPTI